MMLGIDVHAESVPMVQVPQPCANGMTLRQLKHIIVLRIAAFRWSNTFRLTCKPMESTPTPWNIPLQARRKCICTSPGSTPFSS